MIHLKTVDMTFRFEVFKIIKVIHLKTIEMTFRFEVQYAVGFEHKIIHYSVSVTVRT